MRTPIIAGNWKMNNTIEEGLTLIEELKSKTLNTDVEKVVCVPFVFLMSAKKALEDTDIKLGAQNMHWEESGAFTGEISPLMLKSIGVDYVILGHSERRQYFNETDEIVNKKVKSALKHNIKPILCVGETLEQRESGQEKNLIKEQIKNGLKDIEKTDVEKIVVAYEPIWAIGTGKTASADEANDMIGFIRGTIHELYGEVANSIRIQYGGSMKPENARELMSKEEIDGGLIGGASLKSEDFSQVINFKLGGKYE